MDSLLQMMMNVMNISLFLTIYLVHLPFCSASSMFVRDFFISRSINTIEIHACTTNDAIKLVKDLTNDGFQVILARHNRHEENYYRRNHYYKHGIYIDTNCKAGVDLIYMESSLNSFNSSFCWLLYHQNYKSIISTLNQLQLGMTSDVALAVPFDSIYILLYDLYKVLAWQQLISQLIGRWSQSEGLINFALPRRTYNMGRTEIKAGIYFLEKVYHLENVVNELQDDRYNAEHDIANRFTYAISLHIADLYNFSINLVIEDKAWGTKQEDGHFDGLMGLLEREEVNLTITAMQFMSARLDVSDFIFPSHYFNFPFIFKQPRALGTYRALSLQLQTPAWICVGCMLLISIFIYWIVQNVYLRANDPDGEATWSGAVIQVIGVVTLQGLSQEPYRIAGRIACLFILLLALMISVYYNAATMNALLSPAPVSIRNLQQLISSNMPLFLMDIPYFNTRTTRERLLSKEVMHRILSQRQPDFIASLDEGLEIIRTRGAFLGEDFTLYTAIENRFQDSDKCDLSAISALPNVPAGSYIKKYSHLKEILFRGNLRMKEHGLINRQGLHWFPKKPTCGSQQMLLLVDLKVVTIAVSIMICGIVVSITLIFLECFFARINNFYKNDGKIEVKQ
uniref:Ionotropic receptor 75a N-terminal domain-containing protein n=1 Tax=Rhodnius prolixus TaxID=13249 RepID=A0A0H2UI57_RHOPR